MKNTWALMKIVFNHIIMKNNYFKRISGGKMSDFITFQCFLICDYKFFPRGGHKTKECME